MTTDLISVAGVADLAGMTDRQVRAAMNAGRLEAEAYVGTVPVFRVDTIKRWVKNGGKVQPISPALSVVGVQELAERWKVSDHAVKSWRLGGWLPEPDYRIPVGVHPLLVWEITTIQSVEPLCASCHLPVVAVDSRHRPGRRVEVECECGTWNVMKLREVA